MQTRTYRVAVEIETDDVLGDRAVVTIHGRRYRYPWHWTDGLKTVARRAVLDNYRAESIQSVTPERKSVPNVLMVKAEVF